MKKEWADLFFKFKKSHKCKTANMSHGSKLHIQSTNDHPLDAQQEPYKKAYLFKQNVGELSGKKSEE